jgi:protein O-mannosyl-transferase
MNQKISRPWWQQTWLHGLLLVVATIAVYQPAWYGQPVFDDEDHLTPPELSSVSGLVRIWTEIGAVSQYYPVTHSAFWLQHHLWGDAMLGYHLTNILLHAISALLLMRILKRLEVPGAWFAAAVFALHPVHVESVAWISELKNTLSTAFYFGAALSYLHFEATRRRAFYFAALALFVLGLLSKTVIASLPAALLIVFWWKRGRLSWRQDVQPLLPFFVLGALGGLLTVWVERAFIGAEGEAFALSFVERVLVAGRVVWFYLGKLLWPAELIFIYPRWEVSGAVVWQYLFPIAALVLLAVLWSLRRRWRGPLAAALFFGGTLFPVLGFLNVYPFIYSYVADHYQYLASVGVISFVAAGLALLLRARGLWERPAGQGVCLAVLAVLAVLTWRQSRMYTDVPTLWRTTIERNPAGFVAYANLGNHHLERGEVDEALRLAQKAAELRPDFAEVQNNLGNALLAKGQLEAAAEHYRKAVELRPNLAVAHHNLGGVAFRRGSLDEALAHFRRAVELRPDFVKARNNLGSLLLEKGRVDEAMAQIEKALEIRPDDVDALNNLGNILLRKERPDEAIAQYRKALSLQPNDGNALNNLGSALLQKGQVSEAIPLLEKAVELQPDLAQAHSSLGNALFQIKRVDDAIIHFEKVLSLRPADATAHNDLGNARLQKGQVDAAIAHYEKALAISPEYDLAYYNFGYALLQKGDVGAAVVQLQKAVTLQPNFLQSRYQLGNALLQQGALDDAIVHLEKAAALQPEFPDALNDLGVALAQKGMGDEAVAYFKKALVVQPQFAEAHNNLGKVYMLRGAVRDAVIHYRASLKIEPDNPDTLCNLAWVLATWPDASVRNGMQAIYLAQRANKLVGDEAPFALRALAAAYAESGRFPEAVSVAQRAIQRAEAHGNSALANELRQHLTAYQASAPFRETPLSEAPAMLRRL